MSPGPKRRSVPPSRRLKPMPPPWPPPPPARPRFSTPSGVAESKTDQPSVWQRAQKSSNRYCPSVVLARRASHSCDQARLASAVSRASTAALKSRHALACSCISGVTFDGSAFAVSSRSLQSDSNASSVVVAGTPSCSTAAARASSSALFASSTAVCASSTCAAAWPRASSSWSDACFLASSDDSWMVRR